jgi:hypothetical protein
MGAEVNSEGDKKGTSHNAGVKSHSIEWLNYMILNLKFGGPCWT